MKRLVLVGPGHAHLYVLEALARAPLPDVETVLVSLGTRQLYSGMLPGWIAGDHALEQLSFELEGLARAAKARLEPSGALALRADQRELQLGDGRVLGYDVASFDIGSLPAGTELPGVKEHALVLKPLERALAVLSEASQPLGPLLVVGGGAAGVELALCLQARTRRPTLLLERGEEVPRGASRAARRLIRGLLAQRGVELRTGAALASLEPGSARLESGESLPFTTCVWATGARAPELFAPSGAAVDAQGYLAVEDTLRSPSHPELFAAGDCAGFISGQRVPKAGVYAVRQGPVLSANLRAALTGEGALRPYHAQAGFLSLMNAGDGTAVAAWKGLAFHGRAMWHLKDAIDRRFMARFQRLAGQRSEAR
ncbi:FAD-dependent oxidoreductase [Hyalangium gracile]|uniref:FAD-dependent oxidoreductase n=1 Tax=Hyalangium gracile TaxID=394092 RepID=UPI001CCFF8EB|nr:FAD-dependent oxidoreductase [Hyalangium gracile]